MAQALAVDGTPMVAPVLALPLAVVRLLMDLRMPVLDGLEAIRDCCTGR